MIESIEWDGYDTVTPRRAARLTARSGCRRWWAPWTRHPQWSEVPGPTGTRYLIAYGWAPLLITD